MNVERSSAIESWPGQTHETDNWVLYVSNNGLSHQDEVSIAKEMIEGVLAGGRFMGF